LKVFLSQLKILLMNFSTIDEVWGNKKKIKEEVIITESSLPPENLPPPIIKKPKKREYNIPSKKVYFNHTEDSYTDAYTDTINDRHERNELIDRVLKSKRCRNVLRKKFSPNILLKLNNILEDYRDLFVLVLVGFCILIFFSMLYNMNRKVTN
jgi:hypothetical protein